MASLPNSKTVMYEEWLRVPEVTDTIEEVVKGEIRIMPPAKWNADGVLTPKLFPSVSVEIAKIWPD